MNYLCSTIFALFVCAFAGCAGVQTLDEPIEPLADPAEVIGLYNANAQKLDQVAANTSVFARYRDPDTGKMNRDVGDGLLRYRRTRDMAMTVGKQGYKMFFAGGDDDRYWLFDFKKEIAYVGSYADTNASTVSPLPIAARPDQVVMLLGLLPIDVADAQTEWIGEDLLVEPAAGRVRMLLNGRSGLPKRIDLVNSEGYSTVTCTFTGEKAVKQPQGDEADWPIMPAEAHLQVIGEEGDLTLKLYNYTADPAKFNDKAFDFEALKKMHKPKRIEEMR